MHVIHLTSELAPLAKVGGLGDAVAGLAKGLCHAGATVEVILPFYDHLDRRKIKQLREEETLKLALGGGGGDVHVTAWKGVFDGIPVILMELRGQAKEFRRGVIYGEKDDLLRFVHFTVASMEYLFKRRRGGDVLHLHDWLTAIAAPLYREYYQGQGLNIGRVVLTIHNMHYQGVCLPKELEGIGWELKKGALAQALQDPCHPQCFNLLKGGLVYADLLATVSPTYAQEIQGKEGCGLEALVIQEKKKLQGILNGIDTSYWDPATDPFLFSKYPKKGDRIAKILEAKRENRKKLSQKLHLTLGGPTVPLYLVVSRLAEQKGPELLQFGVDYVLHKGGQCLFLGSHPEPALKEVFEHLAKRHRGNPHVHFHFTFDEELAHLAFASADCILIPSLFEPCGLTQMIALRYGTIPIVHQVGGLKDTIFDVDAPQTLPEQGNGYVFHAPSKGEMQQALDRAFADYVDHPRKWEMMVRNGIQKDWSWGKSARDYLSLYSKKLPR